jgi:hypothetical protein
MDLVDYELELEMIVFLEIFLLDLSFSLIKLKIILHPFSIPTELGCY